MFQLSQTKTVNYKVLCSKHLISDLKDAATCEVKTVCQLPCNRCPLPTENIDTKKIKIEGLNSYIVKLEKAENEQLLISITASNIDSWMLKNNLSAINLK